jgi:hypothetical protein
MYDTLSEALKEEEVVCDVLSAWTDEHGRQCSTIEIPGAHRRVARLDLDGSLEIIHESMVD